MARKARKPTDPVARGAASADAARLLRALRERPQDFELFEALRRIECAYPQHPRLGQAARPQDEPVRLGQRASLDFAPRSVDALDETGGGRAPRLRTFPLGLFGPQGALPLHLTEYAIERERMDQDPTLAAFADLFHHRMIALWYRSWADARPTVHADRPGQDRFGGHVDALVGVGQPALRERDALAPDVRRYFAGRFAAQARNAEGLQAAIRTLFDVPLTVQSFFADWLDLPPDGRLGMGRQAARLGQEATMGAKFRNAQHRFRLRIGPLDLPRYREFLPGGRALRELVALVRHYCGDEYLWDLQLVLDRSQVPPPRLGKSQRMGQSLWMGDYRKPEHADDLVLHPALNA
ncbi:type VI secretion system baseplate subunit TssG [Lysobacter enzymogenes]|uniref:type VI secretion system baseplate subunit TssG n=1 Tax=Lysobacter enzymogenes TaxID=69 RepID=UPI001AF913B0|nr:type VI secretion system baseplate subunit TssG [Lysobacter enzymogenes]QQQ03710.1 type VI secretion system baseplate subunit TssG [Lysobacter enzymogenes]